MHVTVQNRHVCLKPSFIFIPSICSACDGSEPSRASETQRYIYRILFMNCAFHMIDAQPARIYKSLLIIDWAPFVIFIQLLIAHPIIYNSRSIIN
jgi:hypothetical protein